MPNIESQHLPDEHIRYVIDRIDPIIVHASASVDCKKQFKAANRTNGERKAYHESTMITCAKIEKFGFS